MKVTPADPHEVGGSYPPARAFVLLTLAVVLMLGGAAMLLADVGASIGIPVVAVGLSLTLIWLRQR